MNNKNTLWWIFGIVIAIIIIILLYMWANPEVSATPNVQTTATDDTTVAATNSPASAVPVEQDTTVTVQSLVNQIPNTSIFASLLSSTGVGATLNSSANAGTKFTLFIPTNDAFNAEPAGFLASLTAAEKLRLVQYHIVSGRALDTDATDYGTIQALSGDALNFSSGVDKVARVNSSVLLKQYNAKNGTIYTINAVLLPPAK